MMRSLFAGVSALRNHQVRMDVIGNNIANVNTVGFKSSRVTFKDLLSQTLRDASAPQNNRGGTNPFQVGLGVNLGTITPTTPRATRRPPASPRTWRSKATATSSSPTARSASTPAPDVRIPGP